MAEEYRETGVTPSGLNIIAGLWLVLAPFILNYTGSPRVNDIVVGLIVAVVGVIRTLAVERTAWISWVNIILGIWLIVAPFFLGYSGVSSALWNDVILGIIVAALSGWSYGASMRRHHAM